MKENLKKFEEIIKEKKLIDSSLELLQWDLETTAPKKGKELIADIFGYLSMKSYNLVTSDEFVKLVEALNEEKEQLNEIQKKEVKDISEEIEKMKKIPPQEYEEYSKLVARSQGVWEEAKNKKDFNLFKEDLKKIFDYNIKFAKYQNKDGKKIYDILLDEYEKGMDSEKLDKFFASLREEIVPLLKRIKESKVKNEFEFLNRKVDTKVQERFNRYLASYLGFDFERGVLAESEHPFTMNIDKNDVRMTTKFYETMPFSSIFSVIHESGHGIYEQQIGDDLQGTTLASGGSMGIHESQSRFYENVLGRSLAFWEGIYRNGIEYFPELKSIDIDELYRGVNKVEPSLIRTEADELTYSLHIMVRYEIEKGIINGEIDIDKLPEIWNSKMKEHLGVVPENDSEGVLQDVHWAGGMVGYFPSYALGSVYAAQLYHKMKEEMDVDGILREGKLEKIREWLGERIHKYGRLKDTAEIIRNITGEDLEPKYYIDYLKEKYSKIYNLD